MNQNGNRFQFQTHRVVLAEVRVRVARQVRGVLRVLLAQAVLLRVRLRLVLVARDARLDRGLAAQGLAVGVVDGRAQHDRREERGAGAGGADEHLRDHLHGAQLY